MIINFETNYGNLGIELFNDKAPQTCKNFLQYVESGFYNDTIFHRVINGFMIQGGGFDTNFIQKSTNAPIDNEADNGLSNQKYTLAMARTSDPHSASSQFFINVADNKFLDFQSATSSGYGYCVFGKLVSGFDVADKIKKAKTQNHKGHADVPQELIIIKNAYISTEANIV